MHYKKHVVVNTILGSLALYLANLPIVFRTLSPAVLVGFLIDVDHFLYHIWKERTLSLRSLTRLVKVDWNEQRLRFYPFHTLEFGIIFTIIVYYTPLSWPWAFGYWVHISTDAYHNWRLRGNFSSWLPVWIGTLQSYQKLQARRKMRGLPKKTYA